MKLILSIFYAKLKEYSVKQMTVVDSMLRLFLRKMGFFNLWQFSKLNIGIPGGIIGVIFDSFINGEVEPLTIVASALLTETRQQS